MRRRAARAEPAPGPCDAAVVGEADVMCAVCLESVSRVAAAVLGLAKDESPGDIDAALKAICTPRR